MAAAPYDAAMTPPWNWLRAAAGAAGVVQGAVLAGAATYGLVFVFRSSGQLGIAGIVVIPGAVVLCVPVIISGLALLVVSARLTAGWYPGAFASLWVFHLIGGAAALTGSIIVDHETIGIAWFAVSVAALGASALATGGLGPPDRRRGTSVVDGTRS